MLTGGDAARDGLRPIPHRPVPTNPHEVPLKSRDGSPFLYRAAPGSGRRESPLCRRAGRGGHRRDARSGDGRCRAPRGRLRPAARGRAVGGCAGARGAAACGRSTAPICASIRRPATRRRRRPPSRGRRMSCGWRRRSTGSPACRWNYARRSASTTRSAARYTVHTGAGGGVVRQRDDIAAVLGVPTAAVRVVSGDIGGNFGIRNNTYPEFALVAWAAKRVGRPVKWSCERRDAFATDFHGRDLTSRGRARLGQGRPFPRPARDEHQQSGRQRDFVCPAGQGNRGLLQRLRHPLLVYARPRGRHQHRPDLGLSQRRAPGGHIRPRAPDRHRLPPPRLRPPRDPAAQPRRRRKRCRTAIRLGLVYDSGDYPASLRRALELADWAGFAARRAEARRHGRCRGIGIANSIELNTGAPRERAEITIDPVWCRRAGAGDDVGGSGPRNELRPGDRRMARGRARPGQAGDRRHRPRAGRRRLGLGAVDAARLVGHRQGRGRRSSRRGAGSPARCSKPPRRISNLRSSALS